MLPNRPTPGSPTDWLRRARSDLALASIALPEGALYSELCFHAQQAAEKSLKAVLIHHGVEFRKVHDLDYLITRLPSHTPLPPEVEEVAALTSYAVQFRYPGDYEEITAEEHREAIQLAWQVYHWAEQIVSTDPAAQSTL
jgi:HEPN domain-containing protein